jgi:AraC-like DNA-binding protein
MGGKANRSPSPGLERSCNPGRGGWLRSAAPGRIGRIEAFFRGHAYDPHRHDTYAVGMTLRGVQAFEYRGQSIASVKGDTIVIHPDERHDGRAGGDEGFHYRMAYVEPAALRAALADPNAPIPFACEAVRPDPRLAQALHLALDDIRTPMEDLQEQQFLVDLADALSARDRSSRAARKAPLCAPAVERARELLHAAQQPVHSQALEAASGLDRFTLARQFRALLGTSPYRYFVMRRLDRARAAISAGAGLSAAAFAAGFADQSHMTRQFRRAYGLSPGAWRTLLDAPARATG